MDQAEDEPDDGRLAGAVGPEEAEDVAATDLHVEAVDGEQRAELLGEGVGAEYDRAAGAALLLRPLLRSTLRLRFRDDLRHATVLITERWRRTPAGQPRAPCLR